MAALGPVIRAGVARHRVRTGVVALVVLVSVCACILGGALLLAANAPFDRAFEQQHGAHLSAQFAADKVSTDQLAGTAHTTGVSAAAGPFRTVSLTPSNSAGSRLPTITVVGRADPSGAAVDAVSLSSGRWASAAGEIVLFSSGRQGERSPQLSDTLTLPGLTGEPKLTVVGVARSVSRTAGGWVTPEYAETLAKAGAPAGYQMLYRLTATDQAGIDAGKAAVTASLPAGALTGALSWLTTRQNTSGSTVLLIPMLIAFGLLSSVMAVLIVGTVVAGSVSSSTRAIGVLKAVGGTPGQVVRVHLWQALLPALVGAVLGVFAGNALTAPVLSNTDEIYGGANTGVPPWLDAVVVGAVLVMVTATAWAAAGRAARLRTVDVLAVGRTPRPGRGRWAARWAALLPVPRPVSVGLAQPFARPLRSASIVAAIAFGVAAATLAVGLGASLARVQSVAEAADVTVEPGRPGPPPAGGGGGGGRRPGRWPGAGGG